MKITDLDIEHKQEKKSASSRYVIQSLRFNNEQPAIDFKALCKRANLKSNQAVFEYMLACTNFVMDELEIRKQKEKLKSIKNKELDNE